MYILCPKLTCHVGKWGNTLFSYHWEIDSLILHYCRDNHTFHHPTVFRKCSNECFLHIGAYYGCRNTSNFGNFLISFEMALRRLQSRRIAEDTQVRYWTWGSSKVKKSHTRTAVVRLSSFLFIREATVRIVI